MAHNVSKRRFVLWARRLKAKRTLLKYRSSFLLNTLLRSLMYVTSSSSSLRTRERLARLSMLHDRPVSQNRGNKIESSVLLVDLSDDAVYSII